MSDLWRSTWVNSVAKSHRARITGPALLDVIFLDLSIESSRTDAELLGRLLAIAVVLGQGMLDCHHFQLLQSHIHRAWANRHDVGRGANWGSTGKVLHVQRVSFAEDDHLVYDILQFAD